MSASILQTEKECYFCRALYDAGEELPTEYTKPLHQHHIVHGTANRTISDKWGCWVWLCPYHHEIAPEAVHNDMRINMHLKRICQKVFEGRYGHYTWMRLFGKNYLD